MRPTLYLLHHSRLQRDLKKIIKNFKKPGSRKYTEKTLRLKLEEINILDKQVKEHNKTEKIKEEGLIRSHKLLVLAKQLLENSLASMSEEQNIANTSNSGSERTEQTIEVKSSNSNSDSKMSYFNLETSLKVIPEFTGIIKS